MYEKKSVEIKSISKIYNKHLDILFHPNSLSFENR